jgi:hypothetical protein
MKGRNFTPGPKLPVVRVGVHEAAIVASVLPWLAC